MTDPLIREQVHREDDKTQADRDDRGEERSSNAGGPDETGRPAAQQEHKHKECARLHGDDHGH